MTLTEDGKVVSDNFYHRSLEENNYQGFVPVGKGCFAVRNNRG